MAHDRNPSGPLNHYSTFEPPWVYRLLQHGLAPWKLWLCLFGPWTLFCFIFGLLSLPSRSDSPRFVSMVVAVSFAPILMTGAAAEDWRPFQRNKTLSASIIKGWLTFLSVTLFIAWLAAILLGSANYIALVEPYYKMINLETYSDVDPIRMTGRQFQNAGIVEFAKGVTLDLSKSASFKNHGVYCVAPIMLGQQTIPVTYDFWAVGTDCCSTGNVSTMAFNCENAQNPRARAGIRHASDDEQPFYKLAVQKAEALHHIKSHNPVFFTWVENPTSTVYHWKTAAVTNFFSGILVHFVVQASLVVTTAALAVPKPCEIPTENGLARYGWQGNLRGLHGM